MAEANPNLAGLLLASGSQILSIRSLLRLVQRGSPEETAGSCWVCRECASVSSISRDFPSKDLPGVQSQLLQCFWGGWRHGEVGTLVRSQESRDLNLAAACAQLRGGWWEGPARRCSPPPLPAPAILSNPLPPPPPTTKVLGPPAGRRQPTPPTSPAGPQQRRRRRRHCHRRPPPHRGPASSAGLEDEPPGSRSPRALTPAERAASPQRATKAVARHSPRHRLHRSRRPSAAPREGARTRGGRGGVGGAQGVRGGLGAVTSAGLGGASGDLGASSRVSPVAGSLAAAEVGICSEEHRSLSAQASRNALCAEG